MTPLYFREYFKGCDCEGDVKKIYRGLARAHHPDIGGTVERFQLLQEEYQYQLRRVSGGTTYTSERYTYSDAHSDYEDIYRAWREYQKTSGRAQRKTEWKTKEEKENKLLKIFGAILSIVLRTMGVNLNIKFK